jgi:hypothetical protein
MPCRSNGNEENFSLECILQCKCYKVGSTAGIVFAEYTTDFLSLLVIFIKLCS